MGLIIDLFAGGGGASLGLRWALGRDPDIAINHDAQAVAMHQANHPGTLRLVNDVWTVPPLYATKGQPVDLLWASPDCKHFSKAKGGRPREQGIRDLAWVVVEWAKTARPNLIILENVEEFRTWGPLDDAGHPVRELAGTTFDAWVRKLRRAGYRVEWRELRASDFGAPTIRKRLFLIARRDGLPIIWPEPTHGPGRPEPHRTAAECIDWSLPCPSIFNRKRPLAENTLKRIAAGIKRFVIDAATPFIVCPNHSGNPYFQGQAIGQPLGTITSRPSHALVTPLITEHANAGQLRTWPAGTPLRTICAQVKGGHFALLSPTLIQTGYGEREGQAPRVPGLDKPLGTVVAGGAKHALVSAFLAGAGGPVYGGKPVPVNRPWGTLLAENHQALCAAFLAKHYGGVVGSPLPQPIGTITGVDHHSLVTSHLCKLRGTCKDGQDLRQPAPTCTAGGTHAAEVRALLIKYYGQGTGQPLQEPAATVTAKDRMGLVTVTIGGEPYVIADIGLRMLQPRELFRAQGFPDSYIIGDDPAQGLSLPKTAQVRLCGNSVCPPIAAALARANAAQAVEEVA